MKLIFTFLIILFASLSYGQGQGKKEVKADRKQIEKLGSAFNWQAFDNTSTISFDSIRPELIQGIWKAYNGLFRFGGTINSMNLTTPFTIEIAGDKERRSSDSPFEILTINQNHITTDSTHDNGYINKITESLLVITWELNGNFTRYYYEKK